MQSLIDINMPSDRVQKKITLYGSIPKDKWGQMCPDNAENTLDYAEISTIKAFPMYMYQTIQWNKKYFKKLSVK